jgi:hypothetical protein
MRIALYAPFKPLDHPNPSGDLIIANGIKDFFEKPSLAGNIEAYLLDDIEDDGKVVTSVVDR